MVTNRPILYIVYIFRNTNHVVASRCWTGVLG